MKVPFVSYGEGYRKYKDEYDEAYFRVMNGGDLILRKDVEEFEQNLAKYVRKKYAVALNSGTDALELSLRAFKIGTGDVVVTVSNTFKSTITAIKKVGAIPILTDIGKDYLSNGFYSFSGEQPKVIIQVHLSGDAIPSFVSGIPIIEDACQAFGNKNVGYGDIQCWSFYPAKILGGFGDGGAITTDNKDIADWIRNYRNHCKDKPGEDGMNSRMDNLQAAFLNVKLRHIDEILKRRQEVAGMYREGLKNCPIVLPDGNPGRAWQDYIIRIKERESLKNHLDFNDIETMIPPILPHLELGLPFKLPKSEEYNQQFLRLPCNEHLTNEQVEYVIDKIKIFYGC